jgi:hypothetical protein
MKLAIIKLLATLVTVAAGTFVAVVIFIASSIATKIAMVSIVIIIAFEITIIGFIWDNKHKNDPDLDEE